MIKYRIEVRNFLNNTLFQETLLKVNFRLCYPYYTGIIDSVKDTDNAKLEILITRDTWEAKVTRIVDN